MPQQINLYQAELRPQKLAFSARFMATAGSGLIVICALFSGYTHWQAVRAQQSLTAATAELSAWQSRSDQMQSQLTSIRTDASLERDLLQAQKQIAALRRISDYLEQASSRPEHGHAAYLSALARGTIDGVWLTQISIEGSGRQLAISGAALQPRLLPGFIDALSQESAFADKNFLALRIEREPPPADQVSFQLSTREIERQ